jgi:hypothetical protein
MCQNLSWNLCWIKREIALNEGCQHNDCNVAVTKRGTQGIHEAQKTSVSVCVCVCVCLSVFVTAFEPEFLSVK